MRSVKHNSRSIEISHDSGTETEVSGLYKLVKKTRACSYWLGMNAFC